MGISKAQAEYMILLAGEIKAREAMERAWADLSSTERTDSWRGVVPWRVR